jgi:hypothetical protein
MGVRARFLRAHGHTCGVTAQVDSRCTLNSQRKVGRAFLPDPEALEGQPGMADLPRLPEQLPCGERWTPQRSSRRLRNRWAYSERQGRWAGDRERKAAAPPAFVRKLRRDMPDPLSRHSFTKNLLSQDSFPRCASRRWPEYLRWRDGRTCGGACRRREFRGKELPFCCRGAAWATTTAVAICATSRLRVVTVMAVMCRTVSGKVVAIAKRPSATAGRQPTGYQCGAAVPAAILELAGGTPAPLSLQTE